MGSQRYSKSEKLFNKARQVLPGGVNSPVRAFKAVGGTPPFIAEGKGANVTDEDGNRYIDYVGSYGPLLFGHSPDFVVEALRERIGKGTVFGAPTELEVQMAELVGRFVPSIEVVRFVNSGSEATTSAVRLARGFTGRSKVIKCAGCFHGSVDTLLATAGSGLATLGIPDTAGVPASVAAETVVVEYNDLDSLEKAFERFGGEIAAFIVEPLAGNMGLVPPQPGYLQAARELTEKHGSLLIFDEVITGFRVAPGGAQELYEVKPDLTCLGKIIGGGVPCGAYGGRREIMERLAPLGPVYQAGTLSGNPLAMTAGLATLREISSRGAELYHRLNQLGDRLASGLSKVFASENVPVQLHRVGSLLTAFITSDLVTNFTEAQRCDTDHFRRMFHGLLDREVYIAPSQYECLFVSAAHTEEQIDQTIAAFAVALEV